MADSTSTVGSGQDYTTSQAWFDAKDGETGTHTGRFKDEALAGSLLANNGSTAATAFIMEAQSAHDGRAREVSGSGSTLEHTGRVVWWFKANGANLTIVDMCLQQTAGSDDIVDCDDTGSEVTLTRCVAIKTNGGTATGPGVSLRSAAVATVRDGVIYGHTGFGLDLRGASGGSCTGNSVYGDPGSGTYGILSDTTNTSPVANNISVGHSVEDFFGADAADSNHGSNISEDATASTEWDGGGGSHNSVEVLDNSTSPTPTGDYVCFANLTGGNEDFSLVDLEHGTHNAVAIGGGFSGEGSGTGVNGVTRHASAPDIGAFETAAAAAGDLTKLIGSGGLTGTSRLIGNGGGLVA